ncbi:hypothetical protein B2M23_11660 [Eubacterium limosum]|uniref:Uncharacterized protein n=2 Tax=Eubacterium limosum TaxID=1736 RepID=A0AAC9W2Y0_EUBLI|nr:hypothetical protein B2M23_11660 [Eubacterium limosum]
MKKVMRRSCFILFFTVLLTTLVPISRANAMSKFEFDQKLNEAQIEYWHGKKQTFFDHGETCHGYARQLTKVIFGVECGNGLGKGWIRIDANSNDSKINNVHIGDLVRFRNTPSLDHTIIVTNIIGDTIIYTDCNSDGQSTIKWNQQISKGTLAGKLSQPLVFNQGAYGYIAHYAANPVQSTLPCEHDLDSPRQGDCVFGDGFILQGWALDGEGISRVTYTIFNEATGKTSQEQDMQMGMERIDVYNIYPQYNNRNAGYYKYIDSRELEKGHNIIDVYAYTPSGRKHIEHRGILFIDDTKPVLTNVEIIDLGNKGFTVTGKCSDEGSGVDKIRIAIWSDKYGQEENLWHDIGVGPDQRFYYRVNFDEYHGEKGPYNIHLYAYDRAKNPGFDAIVGYVPMLKPAQIEEKNGHLYALYDTSLTWAGARDQAVFMDGHLATVNSQDEQKFLTAMVEKGEKNSYWIGAETQDYQIWRWITGESFDYRNWSQNQPDNYGNIEDKAAIYSADGTWNDLNNEDRYGTGFIVEYELQNNEGSKMLNYNGKLYTRYDVSLPWNEAQKFCEMKGGRLAVVKDQETQNILKELIQDGGRSEYLLGASAEKNKGEWRWIDNSPLTYTNWGINEPNNTSSCEEYLVMGVDGCWNDRATYFENMQTTLGFICEQEEKPEVVLKIGDVNDDKIINATDALMVLRHSVKEITLKNNEFIRADVTKDNTVNATDALQILRYAVKEIDRFD